VKLVAVMLLLAVATCTAHAGDLHISVRDPRAFGYFIGDTIERTIEIDTGNRMELVPASLPRPGALAYWLDLVAVEHKPSSKAGHEQIRLVYQIFYAALEPKRLDLPGFKLSFRQLQAADTAELVIRDIAPFSFLASPLREIVTPKSEDGALPLRPDAKPSILPTGRARTMVLAWLALAAAAATGLLWYYAVWPFSLWTERPFSRAARRIRAINGDGDDALKRRFLVLHRAIDETAGQRVLAGDLSAFLDRHQAFTSVAPLLMKFFDSSRQAFFRNDTAAARHTLSDHDFTTLTQLLEMRERSGA
jgi:mxaA protein